MAILRYISHPNVQIDPAVLVPRWRLSDEGRRRAEVMTTKPWTKSIGRIISSDETKAMMTAEILDAQRGLGVEVRPQTGETDRSATGFVPHERHEALATKFFANPDVSADGWETSRAAQTRIVTALADVLEGGEQTDETKGNGLPDIAVVGHGGVGTLLYCHLIGSPIAQSMDQPGQGHFWSYDLATSTMIHPWRAIDGDD